MRSKILISMFFASAVLLSSVGALAQDPDEELMEEEEEKARYETSLELNTGAQVVDQDNNSSKFNEYRDDETALYLNRIYLSIDDTETGRYFDFRGRKLSRDDQALYVEFGSFGGQFGSLKGWSVDLDWSETPHLLSNSARTPYDFLGDGVYRVAGGIVDSVQISNIDNASSWTAADAGRGGGGEDSRIARVLGDSVHLIDLGTQRETGAAGLNVYLSERTKARFEFQLDDKDGSILTGAAIGDRPPRSVVVQLPEPIDFTTYDFAFFLEHFNDNFQVDGSYRYSMFKNDMEQMSWNSLFYAADFFCASNPECAGAADFDRVRQGNSREYATTGAMALSPDNTLHNIALNGSIGLPWRSRLSATVAYARMEQDETLLPFATSDFGGALPELPRASADAQIDTTMANLAYAINPLRRLSLKLQYRYYDLDNDTEQDVWQYFTQDTDSSPFKNERINIAYDLERQDFGVDASYYLGKAGTARFAYEREEIERPQREVKETDEDIFKFSYRVSPFRWATFMAGYTRGDRDGSVYDGEITRQSYAFDPFANAEDHDNPLLGFSNAPGLRKFDVADRQRDEVDISLSLLPADSVNINLRYNYRNNDYGGTVPTTITTWDSTALAFVTASIDPTLLGLLEDETNRYAVEVSFSPTDKLSAFGFYSRDDIQNKQRGRFLDENNRINGIGSKDWQDTTGAFLWDATIEDDTDTIGAGVNYAAMEDRLDLNADFTYSNGDVGIRYVPGAAIAEDDTTSIKDYAEWSSPVDAEFELNTVRLGLDYVLTEHLTLGLSYTFETYTVRDWQQEANGAHQNALSENFVADNDPETQGTTQDRPGSRLVRLDDVLAPDYDVHVGIVTFQYKF
jgi:MtrB/PioB family decaheme-associated outer membrane protein